MLFSMIEGFSSSLIALKNNSTIQYKVQRHRTYPAFIELTLNKHPVSKPEILLFPESRLNKATERASYF